MLENTIHYDQLCQSKHAWVWVYVQQASPFLISIMHAHLKKNMSYVYANRAYDQFVNAHVQVYDRHASPFSISIMHAHLKINLKKKNLFIFKKKF